MRCAQCGRFLKVIASQWAVESSPQFGMHGWRVQCESGCISSGFTTSLREITDFVKLYAYDPLRDAYPLTESEWLQYRILINDWNDARATKDWLRADVLREQVKLWDESLSGNSDQFHPWFDRSAAMRLAKRKPTDLPMGWHRQ